MAVTMVCVPVCAKEKKSEKSDVLYEQDFSSLDVSNLDVYGYGYAQGGYETIAVEDGALRVSALGTDAAGNTLGGHYGTRIKLYDVPTELTEYSLSIDVKIHSFVGAENSWGPSILVADNGETDVSLKGEEAISKFSMIWMRQFNIGATGAYTYGDTSKNVTKQDMEGFCTPGNYRITVYVDNVYNTGIFSIINLDLGTEYKDGFSYNPCGVTPMVGVGASGCDVSYDNLTVYNGNDAFETAEYKDAVAETPDGTADTKEDVTDKSIPLMYVIVGAIEFVLIVAAIVMVIVVNIEKRLRKKYMIHKSLAE